MFFWSRTKQLTTPAKNFVTQTKKMDLQIFQNKNLLKIFLWTRGNQFRDIQLKFSPSKPENFSKNFKEIPLFSTKCPSGRVEISFDNLSENFSPKTRKFFA